MTSWFNTTSMNPAFASQLRCALAMHAQTNPLETFQALQTLRALDQMGGWGGMQANMPFSGAGKMAAPHCGCVPAPQQQYAGAPAGHGLSKNPEGWPQGSVRTAGGYTIVPEGNTNWSIYAPGQKHGEKAHTRVWGDPHVDEKDGTRWDFTKNSDFLLPDGTRINCQTSSEKGQSVSTGLTITNGADRVDVTGVNGRPTTGDIKMDGYEWRAQHLASNPGRDTFRLGGDGTNVQWFKETGGVDQGLITGARYDGKTQRYEQIVDGNKKYCVDPGMQAPFGSPAWGNQLRTEVLDQIARLPISPEHREFLSKYIAADHFQGHLNTLFGGFSPFGGLGTSFGGWDQAWGSVGGMGDLLMMQQLASQSIYGHRANMMWC